MLKTNQTQSKQTQPAVIAPNHTPSEVDRTIYIDHRIGSKDLYPFLVALNVPVRLVEMESADIRFQGLGADGEVVTIGIERKRIKDAINSMRTGRFMGHQAVGLIETCKDPVLLVEGYYRPGNDGELESPLGMGKWCPVRIGKSVFTYREFDNWLNSIAVLTPIRVIRSNSQAETVRIITDLWHWWAKPMDKHKSITVFHKTAPRRIELDRPSFLRRVAKELDGVGWDKAKDIEKEFKSVAAMVHATEEDWERIDGIGKELSKRAVEQLWGEGRK
jgi:ERCC4-type nuclease